MVIWAEIAHLLGALTPVTPLPALMGPIVTGRCLWGFWLGLRADAAAPPSHPWCPSEFSLLVYLGLPLVPTQPLSSFSRPGVWLSINYSSILWVYNLQSSELRSNHCFVGWILNLTQDYLVLTIILRLLLYFHVNLSSADFRCSSFFSFSLKDDLYLCHLNPTINIYNVPQSNFFYVDMLIDMLI